MTPTEQVILNWLIDNAPSDGRQSLLGLRSDDPDRAREQLARNLANRLNGIELERAVVAKLNWTPPAKRPEADRAITIRVHQDGSTQIVVPPG